MSKPTVHAKSSARKYGGKWEDYIAIHDLMDSSKGAFADNRHRFLTHNAWFIQPNGVLETVFGKILVNSDGREVDVRTIGEQHIMEDFGFIPTVQDWGESVPIQGWMNGRGLPPSLRSSRKLSSEAEAVSD